jgi:hypothetical protein
MGVDPAIAVLAVIISHWDDDHIKGVANLVEAASVAKIISSAAILDKDFVKLTQLFHGDRTRVGKTGIEEIVRVHELMAQTGRTLTNAIQNREVFLAGMAGLSHGLDVRIRTLSPADYELNTFNSWVGSQMPSVRQTKGRFPRRSRNDLSVVLEVTVGKDVVLLGGDLEKEEGNPETGWSAVLASNAGGSWKKAAVFKVAHHGSHTGFHEGVWQQMLVEDVHAILAPWINGGKLVPSDAERARIVGMTPNAFTTSVARVRRQPDRERSALRTIAESVENFRSIEPLTGQVRLRKSMSVAEPWTVELFQGATALQNWPAPPAKPAPARRTPRRRSARTV